MSSKDGSPLGSQPVGLGAKYINFLFYKFIYNPELTMVNTSYLFNDICIFCE